MIKKIKEYYNKLFRIRNQDEDISKEDIQKFVRKFWLKITILLFIIHIIVVYFNHIKDIHVH